MDTLLAVLTSMMLSYAPYNATDVLIDKEEAFCLAQNVYHEAKGENLAGKSAVAHVTLNRVAHKKYPNTPWCYKQAKYRTIERIRSNTGMSPAGTVMVIR